MGCKLAMSFITYNRAKHIKEDLERIFIRNYTASEDHSGSGLGLAIAKSLAEQMGADIHVFSEPKKKTIFTLRLKCCSDFASGS